MLTCASCGQANPDGFRLCGMCGVALHPTPQERVERKVVSVLFCDLVGFTAQAEQMDPEDVRALLEPYHAMVRDELVRHGGTVEKFIGDAVMALFGAPAAHEDDPERAVRAALAIRDRARDRQLQLRIGVTTGEALIAIDAQTDEGQGMDSGDVVNTAARLQAVAPINGILVDTTTRGAIASTGTPLSISIGQSRTVNHIRRTSESGQPWKCWGYGSRRSRVRTRPAPSEHRAGMLPELQSYSVTATASRWTRLATTLSCRRCSRGAASRDCMRACLQP